MYGEAPGQVGCFEAYDFGAGARREQVLVGWRRWEAVVWGVGGDEPDGAKSFGRTSRVCDGHFGGVW
jgi:hypothetical protein